MLKKLLAFFKPQALLTIGVAAAPVAQPYAPDPDANAGWICIDEAEPRPLRYSFEHVARVYPGDFGALERQKAQAGLDAINAPICIEDPRKPRTRRFSR
ncbi:MAG: hypothetical protein WCB12_01280 [Bryobacteraceae bacterium]